MKNYYRLGTHWQERSRHIEKAIKRDGLDNFRSNTAICRGYGDAAYIDPSTKWHSLKATPLRILVNLPIIRRFTNEYLSCIRTHYATAQRYQSYYYKKEFGYLLEKYDLPETTKNGCSDIVNINGQKIARIYIDNLVRIDKFSQHINFSSIETIMEIGGGFGVNAHLLLHLFPNIKEYIYIDISPVLSVAEFYLRQFGLDDRISFYHPDQIQSISADVDVFWNAISFQEMEPDVVLGYLKQIKRLNTQHLCLMGQRTLRYGAHKNYDWVKLVQEYFSVRSIGPSHYKDTGHKLIDHYLGSKLNS